MMNNEDLLNEMIRAYEEEQKYFRRTIASMVLFVVSVFAIIGSLLYYYGVFDAYL